MASVTFSASVGGDGSTVTDDGSPSTGLDAGGHRTRFVPCLAQTVAVAAYTVGRATAAASSASAAATSASNAATSASNAATSASSAATSATNASNSASAAAAAIAAAFPVGAVYITATNTNPGTFLGGTWARIGQGRTLIGEGTLGSDTYAAGATGGAARVTLTTSEMPAHNHGGATGVTSTDHVHTGTTSGSGNHQHTYERFTGGTSGSVATASIDGNGPMRYNDYGNSGWAGDHSHSFTTSNPSQTHTHPVSNEGGGAAHENRMPYLTVYFWQRTA